MCLHCVRLVEAGLATLAWDYVEYVVGSVTGGPMVMQDTVPWLVQYTAYLTEKLKYLVSDHRSDIHAYTVYLCRTLCKPPVWGRYQR